MLARFEDAVPAPRIVLTRLPGHAAVVIRRFDLTGTRATVSADGVAVIALLAGFDDAIATYGLLHATNRERTAHPAGYRLTVSVTAAAGYAILSTQIASFATIDPSVATMRVLLANGFAGRVVRVGWSAVPTGLDLARARAAVAVFRVAVVTFFSGFTLAITADDERNAGLTRRGAGPIGLNLTGSRAAITAYAVAIVALFAQCRLR